jgi:hypothetical protein
MARARGSRCVYIVLLLLLLSLGNVVAWFDAASILRTVFDSAGVLVDPHKDVTPGSSVRNKETFFVVGKKDPSGPFRLDFGRP